MDLNALCVLIFACLLNADGVFAANDCHPKGYGRNALHACIEGVASGSKVAIDASKFDGNSCECKLNGKADANFTVNIKYITSNTGRIKFYVDDNVYNETKTDHGYSSNGETITIRVEMEANLADNVGDGNPCLAFENPNQVDQPYNLTIKCFNGTGINPEMVGQAPTDSTRNIDKTKHVLTSLTHSSISTTQVASSTAESSGSLPENTHDTDTNAGTVLESDANGMEITSQGLEVSTRIIFCAVGCASLAVVVTIVLIICYFKRRRSNASPAIVKADVKGEEEYEVIENPMYNPMEAHG